MLKVPRLTSRLSWGPSSPRMTISVSNTLFSILAPHTTVVLALFLSSVVFEGCKGKRTPIVWIDAVLVSKLGPL